MTPASPRIINESKDNINNDNNAPISGVNYKLDGRVVPIDNKDQQGKESV